LANVNTEYGMGEARAPYPAGETFSTLGAWSEARGAKPYCIEYGINDMGWGYARAPSSYSTSKTRFRFANTAEPYSLEFNAEILWNNSMGPAQSSYMGWGYARAPTTLTRFQQFFSKFLI
jgi:hypothetical protein